MLAIGTDRDIYLLGRLVWEDHESRARGMEASSSIPMGKDTFRRRFSIQIRPCSKFVFEIGARVIEVRKLGRDEGI